MLCNTAATAPTFFIMRQQQQQRRENNQNLCVLGVSAVQKS
jgi:hypothetical protein